MKPSYSSSKIAYEASYLNCPYLTYYLIKLNKLGWLDFDDSRSDDWLSIKRKMKARQRRKVVAFCQDLSVESRIGHQCRKDNYVETISNTESVYKARKSFGPR